MTDLPDIVVTCPRCGSVDAHHPMSPGVFATWPDETAAHYRRECHHCGHTWRIPG